MEEAAARGLALSVEGHVGSDVDSPEKLARLLELTPGLTLTLDYCHYTYLDYPDREVEPLLAHSRHLQCRAAAEGQLQVRYQDNAIDYSRVVEVLSELDYRGYLGLEYVWMEKWDCDRVENTMETIQLRDLFRSLAGQR